MCSIVLNVVSTSHPSRYHSLKVGNIRRGDTRGGETMPFAPMIPRRIEGLLQEANRLAQEGRYPEAIDVTIEARDLALCHLGKGHPIFARSLSYLGTFLVEMNDLDAAEPLLRQAVELNRAVLGERHPDYANSLCDLAVLFRGKRAFDAAEPLLQQAVEIAREALGEWHPDLADALERVMNCSAVFPGVSGEEEA